MNTISPGPIDTPQFREGKPQSIIDSIAKQSPSRRLGDPEDVAPIVGFLASPAAQWINGQNIRIDGVSQRQTKCMTVLTVDIGPRRLVVLDLNIARYISL